MSAEKPFDRTGLSRRAVNQHRILDWLETCGRNEITTVDLREAGNFDEYSGTDRAVAQKLVRRGVLRRLMNGHYEVLRPGASPRGPLTPGELLDRWLRENYALAFGTAMSVHVTCPPKTGPVEA